MKAQHQISFKRRRTGRPRPRQQPTAKIQPSPTLDLTTGRVTIDDRQLHFARAMADTEKPVREASLTSLQSWLKEHGSKLGPEEMDRLWKALFYCIWMADKRPIITATISAVVAFTDVVGWSFLAGGLRCMVREWFGVDRHRVDKFYEMVNALLLKGTSMVCQVEGHDNFVKEVDVWLSILSETVWMQVPRKGLGVALHILDVYIDKIMHPLLIRAAKLPGNQVHKIFDKMLEDLYEKIRTAQGHSLAVGRRIQERVLARLVETVAAEDVSLKMKGQRDMIQRSSKKVFGIAADKKTSDLLRKELYDLCIKFKAFVNTCDEASADNTGTDGEKPAGMDEEKNKNGDERKNAEVD